MVGGGQVAFRKVKSLLDCGAEVEVISPQVCEDLVKMAFNKQLKISRKPYSSRDLKKALVVIAATDEPEVNRQVAEDGKLIAALVNVVDDAAQSDFIVPSYFSRGDTTIAVSTAGKSPALARKIRTNLEKNFGKELAELTSLVSEVRDQLKKQGAHLNGEVWEKSLDLDILLNMLRKGQQQEAKEFLLKGLNSSSAKLETI